MRISRPAITKNVDRLLDAGLIKIARRAADRRQRIVSVSAAGRRILEFSQREVRPLVEAAVKDVWKLWVWSVDGVPSRLHPVEVPGTHYGIA